VEPDELGLIMTIHFALSYMQRPHCRVRERLAWGVMRNLSALIGDDDEDWFEVGALMVQIMDWKERPVNAQKRTELFAEVYKIFRGIAKTFFDPKVWKKAMECERDGDIPF